MVFSGGGDEEEDEEKKSDVLQKYLVYTRLHCIFALSYFDLSFSGFCFSFVFSSFRHDLSCPRGDPTDLSGNRGVQCTLISAILE